MSLEMKQAIKKIRLEMRVMFSYLNEKLELYSQEFSHKLSKVKENTEIIKFVMKCDCGRKVFSLEYKEGYDFQQVLIT